MILQVIGIVLTEFIVSILVQAMAFLNDWSLAKTFVIFSLVTAINIVCLFLFGLDLLMVLG